MGRNAFHEEPRRMHGRDAAGPSPFEARSRCCAPRLAPQGDGDRHISIRSSIADTPSRPRDVFARALLRLTPDERGRREDREPAGSHCPLCETQAACASCTAGNRATGASRPSLRDGWNGLCRALPGERCTIAPVALRMADARVRLDRRITARLGAQTPGARTTRFGRTPITPVVGARSSLTVARPAKLFAPM
jgi:hypothetical protein